MNFSSFTPILKISALTIAGAFLSTMSSVNTMPTTLAEWKAAVMPALWAAFLAERMLLQSAVVKEVASTAGVAQAAQQVKS